MDDVAAKVERKHGQAKTVGSIVSLGGTAAKTQRNAEEGVEVRDLGDQIKNILAMGGGVCASVKALKAIYAVLQSLAPSEFQLRWDVIFFSIYSRRLASELSSLILTSNEVEEALWRQEDTCQPFHHIYMLSKRATRTMVSPFYEDYEKPYYSDFIVWSLMEPKFPIYWSYLLEMYTYKQMSADEKNLPFLPLLELGEEPAKTHLLVLRDRLCQRLHELKISKLNIAKPSYAKKNNLYAFLPFPLNDERLERFLNFYRGGRHNEHIDVQESRRSNGSHLLEVKIDPKGVADIYDYIALKKEEIEGELSRFTTEPFGELVEYYTRQLYERVPDPKKNKDGCLAYYRIRKAADNRRDFFNSIPKKLKQRVIERAQLVLATLDEFYELAQWRYDDVINMLVKLARVSQKTPISLYVTNVNINRHLKSARVEIQTMIGLEFSDEFRKGFNDEFGYEMPCDSLHHVCHFVQPAEALKAIFDRNEDCLLQGGPVVAEY